MNIPNVELIWARYTKIQPNKYYLLIFLGELDNKILALLANELSDNEVKLLKQELPKLRQSSLEDIIYWFRTNTPIVYKKSFRSFDKEGLIIINNYNLNHGS